MKFGLEYANTHNIPKNTAKAENAEDKNDTKEETVTKEYTKPEIDELSNDWMSFQIKIANDVYQLPMVFGELKAYGWDYRDGEKYTDEDSIDPSKDKTIYVKQGSGMQMHITVKNTGDKTANLIDCQVTFIKVDNIYSSYVNDHVYIPGGFKIKEATLDKIMQAYGTPEEDHDYSSHQNIEYRINYDQFMKLTFDNTLEDENARILDSIEIEYESK